MTTDDINSIGRLRLGPFQRRHNVGEHGRLRDTRSFGLFKSLLLDSHSSVRTLRGFDELAVKPITSGADAAIWIVLIRQSVAAAETYQLADRVFDIARVNFSDDF